MNGVYYKMNVELEIVDENLRAYLKNNIHANSPVYIQRKTSGSKFFIYNPEFSSEQQNWFVSPVEAMNPSTRSAPRGNLMRMTPFPGPDK